MHNIPPARMPAARFSLALALHSIASIGVTGTLTNTSLSNSNTQVFTGGFTRTNGSAGTAGVAELSGSLLLVSTAFDRQFADDPAHTAAALALPHMRGSQAANDAVLRRTA